MAFDQKLLTTTLVFAMSNLFFKRMICFGREHFVFAVYDFSFAAMKFQMVVFDFIFSMIIKFVVLH